MFNITKVGMAKIPEPSLQHTILFFDFQLPEFCEVAAGYSYSLGYSSLHPCPLFKFNRRFPVIYMCTHHIRHGEGMIEFFNVSGLNAEQEAISAISPVNLNVPSGSSITSGAGGLTYTINTNTNNYLISHTSGFPAFNFSGFDTYVANAFTVTLTSGSTVVFHSNPTTNIVPVEAYAVSLDTASNATISVVKGALENNRVVLTPFTSAFKLKYTELLVITTGDTTRVYFRCEENPLIPDGGFFVLPHKIVGISCPVGRIDISRRVVVSSGSVMFQDSLETFMFDVPTIKYVEGSPPTSASATGYFAPLYLEKREDNLFRAYGIQYQNSPANLLVWAGYVTREGDFTEPPEVILKLASTTTITPLSRPLSQTVPLTGIRATHSINSQTWGVAFGKPFSETETEINALLLLSPSFNYYLQTTLAAIYIKYNKVTKQTSFFLHSVDTPRQLTTPVIIGRDVFVPRGAISIG